MSYQPIFLLWITWMGGSGRCDIYFDISKAFHIIRDEILLSQGNKSTMMCWQSWLKRQKCCQERADKKAAFIKCVLYKDPLG